jgi:uncharacterized protein
MRLTRFGDPRAFAAAATAALSRHEAENNLMLGLIQTLVETPELYPQRPYLALVHEGQAVRALALRTPPHNVILTRTRDRRLLARVARDLTEAGQSLPGVIADPHTAEAFARIWCLPRGLRHERDMAERIYELTRVRPVAAPDGRWRPATTDDRDRVRDWLAAFGTEAIHGAIPWSDVTAMTDRWIAGIGRRLFLWEDGVPVSLAGVGGATPTGVRVGPVYTPATHRQHGYATALVAAVSQAELDAGRSRCFLFTDLANPTSNHIYQSIGYEVVADVDQVRFVGGATMEGSRPQRA